MIDHADIFDLDLPIGWLVALPGEESIRDRPLLDGDTVLVRCGDAVAGFALADGALRWQAQVAPAATASERLLRAGDLLITDYRKPPERTVSFAALRPGGEVVWRADTGGVILRDSVTVCGDDFLVLSGGKREGKTLRLIDVATGAVRSTSPLWEGATTALSIGDGVWVSSSDDGNGLVIMGPAPQRVVNPRAAQHMVGDADGVVTLTRTGDLQLWAPDGTRRWSSPGCVARAALDGDEVLTFSGNPETPRPLLLSRGDGAARWRGDPLRSAPLGGWLLPTIVLVRLERGLAILDRATGRTIAVGEGHFSWGGAQAANQLVLGCSELLFRVDLPR